MVRMKKSTMFLMCSEGNTAGQVKRKLVSILCEDARMIGLFQDNDGAMVEASDVDQMLSRRGLAAGRHPAELEVTRGARGDTPCTMHHEPCTR